MDREVFPAFKPSPYIGLMQYAYLLRKYRTDTSDASTQTPKTDYQRIGEVVVKHCPRPDVIWDYINTSEPLISAPSQIPDEHKETE